MFEINGQRLLESLRELAAFGKVGTGVNRTAFTPEDIRARHWLRAEMEKLGLDARIDRFGNVYGQARHAEKAVLIGSHTDTVPNGGWLDGALGVMYGLEIARTLHDLQLPVAVDVISFQDEEGTFVPCLGSKAFCGVLDEAEVERAVAADGRRLVDEMAKADLPDVTLRLDPNRHIGFVEAHIEQGPRLEKGDIRVGVVEGIVGIRRYRVSARGQADHAGTTPMSMRKDAGAALVHLASDLLKRFPTWAGQNTVWNIGKFEFEPGAANVVPAKATFIIEFRDGTAETVAKLEENVRATIEAHANAAPVDIAYDSIGSVEPVSMDARMQALFRQAAEWRGDKPMTLPSGAGHDAMILAPVVPTAMIFVPSIDGRSHDVSEDTKPDDIVFGCQVMADGVAQICGAQGAL
jgi:N-carbamoyl-L-amino-acid hydrolase